MYTVTLIRPPVQNDFRADYFPRKIKYKVDAQKLVDEVASKGGEAKLEKTS